MTDQAAMDALAELVACKDLKDRLDAWKSGDTTIAEHVTLIDDYRRRKPLAWAAARAVLLRKTA